MESHCRYIFAIVFFTITTLVISASSYRPVYTSRIGHAEVVQKSPILFRAFPLQLTSQLYRVYLVVELQYDFMQFFETNHSYQARVQLEAIFHDPAQGITRNRIWNVYTQTESFDSTNLKNTYRVTVDSITLPPGSYRIQLMYRDLNSNRTLQLNTQLVIRNATKVFYPLPLFCYTEIPHRWQRPSSFLLCRWPSALSDYWDFNRDAEWIFHVYPTDTTNAIPLKLLFRSAKTNLEVLQIDTTLTFNPHNGTALMKLPLHRLPEGKYEVIVNIDQKSQAIRYTVPLNIVWFTKPLSLWSLDTAIPPLQYIMDNAAYEELTRGSRDEVRQKFLAFWKTRDPEPQIPYNPVQEIFYRRVDEANRRWSDRRTPGWKTDRGKVWIIYGKPDAVEDRTLAPEGPRYLKWIYYRNGKRIIAIFDAVEGRKIVTLRTIYTEENDDYVPN